MRTSSVPPREASVLCRAVTALAARARVEREGRLSLNQEAVLGRIATHGPVTPGEVAVQLRMLPQSLTRTFAALEAEGLIVRTPDPADGRQYLLSATSPGRAALRAEMAPRDRWLARTMNEVLTVDERRQLLAAAELMQRLVAAGGSVATP